MPARVFGNPALVDFGRPGGNCGLFRGVALGFSRQSVHGSKLLTGKSGQRPVELDHSSPRPQKTTTTKERGFPKGGVIKKGMPIFLLAVGFPLSQPKGVRQLEIT